MPVSDHRKSGWTLWREIYGTFVGVLPLILAICAFGYSLQRDNDRHTLEIQYLQAADVAIKAQMAIMQQDRKDSRIEVLQRLDKIDGKIEDLQKQVARAIR